MSDFNIFNPGDIFDSRDVIERVQELRDEFMSNAGGDDPDEYTMSEDDWALGLGTDGAAEMVALIQFVNEAESVEGWEYGVTFIADGYFASYTEQFAEDIGAIDEHQRWPACHIDWDAAAADLQQDYTDVQVNGSRYWAR